MASTWRYRQYINAKIITKIREIITGINQELLEESTTDEENERSETGCIVDGIIEVGIEVGISAVGSAVGY